MTALDVITWLLLAAATVLNIAIWVRQRHIDHAIRACPGHQVGETVRFVNDDGTAFHLRVGDRPEET